MSEQITVLPRHQYGAFLKQLPDDWEQKEISQIGAVVGGGTPSREVPSFWQGSIPWVTPGEVSREDAKLLHDTNDHISASGLAGSGANLLPTGSLLVTTRATLGARVINAVPMATNQGFKSVVFKRPEEVSFYFHLFEKVKPELVRRASGTTFLEISGAEFGSIKVPSPSPNEKQKISQILDTLNTSIHETETIIVKLKALKQGLVHDLLSRGIDANGELRPPRAEEPHLYKESPLGWIPKEWEVVTLESMSKTVTSGSRDWARFYADSGALFVRIGSHRLKLVDDQDTPLKLVNGRFALRHDAQAGAREHFVRWYSERARVWLSGRVTEYQSRMEVAPAGVRVQDLGYRWGSCGKGDWLYFHWKTILLPSRIAEYVVVHEIAHLHEPHHTPAFWVRVERAMPDYAQRKAWLAEHGIDIEGI